MQGTDSLSDKHLRPIIPAGAITHADLCVGRVEDIGAMAAGIHPGVHDGGRRPLPVGDVFPGGAVGEAKGPDRSHRLHCEHGAAGHSGSGSGEMSGERYDLRGDGPED